MNEDLELQCQEGSFAEFTITAFSSDGMLVIPTGKGVCYLTKEQAKTFFNLTEVLHD